MDRYVVYPGSDGTVTIADTLTGKFQIVKSPTGTSPEKGAIRVRGLAPAASQMFCSLPTT